MAPRQGLSFQFFYSVFWQSGNRHTNAASSLLKLPAALSMYVCMMLLYSSLCCASDPFLFWMCLEFVWSFPPPSGSNPKTGLSLLLLSSLGVQLKISIHFAVLNAVTCRMVSGIDCCRSSLLSTDSISIEANYGQFSYMWFASYGSTEASTHQKSYVVFVASTVSVCDRWSTHLIRWCKLDFLHSSWIRHAWVPVSYSIMLLLEFHPVDNTSFINEV